MSLLNGGIACLIMYTIVLFGMIVVLSMAETASMLVQHSIHQRIFTESALGLAQLDKIIIGKEEGTVICSHGLIFSRVSEVAPLLYQRFLSYIVG